MLETDRLHKLGNTKEILSVADRIGVKARLLPATVGSNLISKAINIYRPSKTSGHLAIHKNSASIPLEAVEFTYCGVLGRRPVYVFFDQQGIDKGLVVSVREGVRLCDLLKESFGMEYFVTDKRFSYLIAVNWYVLEVAGDLKGKLVDFSQNQPRM
jgi:hypothetical protein